MQEESEAAAVCECTAGAGSGTLHCSTTHIHKLLEMLDCVVGALIPAPVPVGKVLGSAIGIVDVCDVNNATAHGWRRR